MVRFFGERIVQAALVLLGVTIVVFILTRLSGDPALLLLGPTATNEQIAALRQRLGLEDPLVVQYFRFLADAARGDFGNSIRFREPALGLVLSRLPATAELGAASLVVGLLVAIPAGIVSAYNP